MKRILLYKYRPMTHLVLCLILVQASLTTTKAHVDMMVRPSSSATHTPCVVLLHGLARSPKSMRKMATFLENKGYKTVNLGYPSRTALVEDLSGPAIKNALKTCNTKGTVHFVTHSMGGIILRHYLGAHEIKNIGRIVMLSPPNQGSEIVDKLGNWPGYKLLNGPAGQQLGTSPTDLPKQIKNENMDLGIIAGSRSINLVLSSLIPGKDDGKVSIENTKIETMNDHITMKASHPFIMKKSSVLKQVGHYLEYGKFDQPESIMTHENI